MTPTTPPDGVRRKIRRTGLRATAARIAVLRLLQAADRPLSHAEVSARLAGLGHDAATVYRNLNDLAEAGLAIRMDLGDHVWRFEVRRAEDRGEGRNGHPHALCTCCGTIACLGRGDLPDAGRALPPGWTDLGTAVYHGHCRECS